MTQQRADVLFDQIALRDIGSEPAESALCAVGDWEGQAYCPPAREQPGVYAWGEAHLLWAFLLQYEATAETRYLDVFVERFHTMLNLRDDRYGRYDVLRQRFMPAWGSLRFSHGRYTCWLVHAAMLCYPAARFCRLVSEQPALACRYLSDFTAFLTAIKETVAAYEPLWREGPLSAEGYYLEPAMPDDGHLPLNQQNAMGRVMLEMEKLSGCEGYRERVAKLARSLSHRMWLERDGACQWAYRPPLFPPFDGQGTEDISHAAINADFAWACMKEGIVFSSEDLSHFCVTFKKRICPRGEGIADNIDGSMRNGTFAHMLGYWGRLGADDPAIVHIIQQTEHGLPGPLTGPLALLTQAMLTWLGRRRQ